MIRLSPTLLDAFWWYQNAEDNDKARQEFLARLRRTGVTSEAMQRGIDFEDCVAGRRDLPPDDKYCRCVDEVRETVGDGLQQFHVERVLGDEVLIHGYIDWLSPPMIFDVKTTSRYEPGKYLHNSQHLAYLYCLEPVNIRRFAYVVTDFRAVYREDYAWTDDTEDRLKSRVADLLEYFAVDAEAREAFEEYQHGKAVLV
jgi:hypothetical protein